MAFIYMTLEQAMDVHARTVDVSGGGQLGHLNIGQLESVLQNIQNDDWYPTFARKLTHLFHSAATFHCFIDGNKRIAITLCAQMLLLNGHVFLVPTFIREMENVSYHVAAGKIDKDLLGDIITAVLDGDADNEPLKLRVLKAIQE